MPRVFLMRQVHVAETDDKAHEEARNIWRAREGGAVPVGGGPIEKTRIGWGTHARGMGRDSERPDDKARGETMRLARESYEFNIEQGLAHRRQPGDGHPQARGGQAADRLRHLLHQSRDRRDASRSWCATRSACSAQQVVPAFK